MIRVLAIVVVGLAAFGCGPSEDKRPEPQGSKDLSNQAAQGWTPEQKKANLRMALILASVALVFFAGFMIKMALLGG